MEHLEHPDLETWEERRLWFEGLQAEAGDRGAAPVLSEQAVALMIDLQAVYCAGAWAATVVLAATIVESQRRLLRADDALREELAWLRRMRNQLIHEDAKRPLLSLQDQWTGRGDWEKHARRAIMVTFAVLHPSERQRLRLAAMDLEDFDDREEDEDW